MGGSSLDFTSNTINLVLFGKTGNGKSATGNSILGRNVFLSKPSLFGVTSTCELQSTVSKNGRFLNVIDIPALFHHSDEAKSTSMEIVRCVNLAKDGIHAFLMVFSVRSRFSSDEEAAIESLKTFFVEKILQYMIVIFTGGDDLESSGASLEECLCHKQHRSLQKFVQSCNRRIIFFDNKTSDKNKQAKQLDGLMHLVDTVIANNRGKPFSDNIFYELNEVSLMFHQRQNEVESMKECSEQEISALMEETSKSYHDHLAQIIEKLHKVEEKLKQNNEKLQKKFAEELVARPESEVFEESRIKSEEVNPQLRKNLEPARRPVAEFKNCVWINWSCAIM